MYNQLKSSPTEIFRSLTVSSILYMPLCPGQVYILGYSSSTDVELTAMQETHLLLCVERHRRTIFLFVLWNKFHFHDRK